MISERAFILQYNLILEHPYNTRAQQKNDNIANLARNDVWPELFQENESMCLKFEDTRL